MSDQRSISESIKQGTGPCSRVEIRRQSNSRQLKSKLISDKTTLPRPKNLVAKAVAQTARNLNIKQVVALVIGIGGLALAFSSPPPDPTPGEPPAPVAANAPIENTLIENTFTPPSTPALISDNEPEIMPSGEAAPGPRNIQGPPLPPPTTHTLELRSGDALIDVLTRAGASQRDAFLAVSAIGQELDLRRLQIGQEIEVSTSPLISHGRDGKLLAASVRSDFDRKINALRSSNGSYGVTSESLETLAISMFSQARIEDSLFLSAERAGVPADIIVEMIRIFSFEVDFQRDVRRGDSFAIYFDRHLALNQDELENGAIQYARMILRGRTIEYFRYKPEDTERSGYFSPDGASARRALLKTPVDHARVITDRYGMRRHPVLDYQRMHRGLDFRAPTGTPILAAGDGVVERASRYGSFGNYILIRHDGVYKTAYAHLSRYGRGIRAGVRVVQGQIIGYSGSTGRVNGPHLHYEVLVNGNQINPSTLDLPTGRRLEGSELQAFKAESAIFRAEIDALLAIDDHALQSLNSP
jgi:murein DD-endopeptidase MepM/ murein hydrolase activator NlpD